MEAKVDGLNSGIDVEEQSHYKSLRESQNDEIVREMKR
jgi:hypothetical protein